MRQGIILNFLLLLVVEAQNQIEHLSVARSSSSIWGILTQFFSHPQVEVPTMNLIETSTSRQSLTPMVLESNGDDDSDNISLDQHIPSNSTRIENIDSPLPNEEIPSLVEIEQLIFDENYSQAIDNLFSFLESFPTHQRANSLLGYCLLTIHESILAENFLSIAVTQSNYSDSNALLNLIECLKLNQRHEVAFSLLIHLKSSYPEEDSHLLEYSSSSSYYLIGTIYEHQQEYLLAQEWYLSAALYHSDDTLAWLRASTLLYPMEYKNYTLAEIVLLQGVKYNPTNSELLFNLAALFHGTNRILEAKIFYEETLRVAPNMTSAIANYATILHTVGQLSEAKRFYERAIDLSSTFSSTTATSGGGGAISDGTNNVETSESIVGGHENNGNTNAILFVNYALCLSSLNYHRAAYRAITYATYLDPDDESIRSDQRKLRLSLESTNQMRESILHTIEKLFSNSNFDEVLTTLLSYGEPRNEDEDSEIMKWFDERVRVDEKEGGEDEEESGRGGGAWWYYTMGIAEYFRKQYPNSIKYCSLANTMTNHRSVLVNSCLGLSYQALGLYPNSIAHFNQSHSLLQHIDTSGTLAPIIDTMPSYSFNLTSYDLQYNLLQAYSLSSQFDHCLTASCDIFHLPSPQKGGIVILALSYVKWSRAGEDTINKYAETAEMRDKHQKIQISSGKLLSEEVSEGMAVCD
jgi:tetratricopeptide (TPR) repeat protein